MSLRIWATLLVLAVFAARTPVEVRAADVSPVLAAAHEGGTESTDKEAEGEHHGPPMGFQKNLALWSLVTFLVFLFVLKKLAWLPLIEGLDRREARIRQDIDDAETARLKAEQLLAEHDAKLAQVQEEVREILAEARRDAEQTRQSILDDARSEATALKDRAIGDIERARDQALTDVFTHMNKAVADATQHVLGRAITGDDQQRLVEQALAEIGQS
jgi:F-type H+-transporting ATPase subunit b